MHPARVFRAAFFLWSSVCCTGCGLYLHDATVESATSQIKTDFDALAAPSMFADQNRNLDEFAKAEDLAIASFGSAQRNEAMLSILRPNVVSAHKPSSLTTFADLVRHDLAAVYRAPDRNGWSPDELQVLGNAQARIIRYNQTKATNLALAAERARQFKSMAPQDKRVTDCARVPPPEQLPPAADAPAADQIYWSIAGHCELWRDSRDYVTRNSDGTTDQSIQSVFEMSTGALRKVHAQIKETDDRGAAESARAAALEAEIDGLLKAEKDAPATTAEQLNDRILQAAQLIQDASPVVRRAGLERLSGILEAALAAELEPTPGAATPPELTGQVAAILGMLRASAGTADAFSARPNADRAAALLIGVAKLRHEMKIAEAGAKYEQLKKSLLEAQQSALLIQAAQLARAHEILSSLSPREASGFADLRKLDETGNRAASEAIAAYQIAWNTGEIPYQVLRFRIIQVDRSAAVEMAEITEQDYRAVVAPALSELAAYGKGGITQETILKVLTNLGLGGLILQGN